MGICYTVANMIPVPIHAKPLRSCQIFRTEGQTLFEGSFRWAPGVTIRIIRSVVDTELPDKPGSCTAGLDVLNFSEGKGRDEMNITWSCAACVARYELHMIRERGI